MSDPRSTPESPQQVPSRRRFLKGGVALSAALVTGAGHPLAGRAQPAPDDPRRSSVVPSGPMASAHASSRLLERSLPRQ
jgi:hypothetical protein